jgi:SEC-C motif-containing protein
VKGETGAMDSPRCPCCSGRALVDCCGRYLDEGLPAPSPEALMRSRYTAFTRGTPAAIAYLVATHHPDHRGPDLARELAASVAALDGWDGLEVLAASADGDTGLVEFVATYRRAGARGQLLERSSFVREDGRWTYTTGVVG